MPTNNSIRMNLSKYSMENEIRLLLSVPQNKSKAIIILEGQDDIKLFMSLLNLDNLYLFESYGGKPAIKDILQVRFLNEKRIIGIADRDYEIQKIDRLFFCDYCNAEMMVVSNNDSVAYTLFTVTDKWLDINSIRNLVLIKLTYLSVIRKINEEKDWGLSFQNVPIHEIIKASERDIPMQAIRAINGKNRANVIDEQRKALVDAEVERVSNENLLQFTNGHDFLKALLREIKNLFPNIKKITSINSDELGSFLRLGYRKEHFITTNLYKNLNEYQSRYNLKIV